jgi:5-methylcytosine-specific restriction endonuclease McrA
LREWRHNPETLKEALLTDRVLRAPCRLRNRITPDKRRRIVAVLLEVHGSHCWLCNKPICDDKPTLDHIVPRSKGGRNAIANLRLAHEECNRKRGDGPVPELLLTDDMRLLVKEAA